MRFDFTEEQLLLRKSMRTLLERELPPTAVRAAWAGPNDAARDRWRKLGALGVLGVAVPEGLGGFGGDELDLIMPAEEAGWAALPEPLLRAAGVAAPMLAESAAAAVRDEWLPRLIAGQATVLFAHQGGLVPGAAEADLLLVANGDRVRAVPRAEAEVTAQPSVDSSRRLCTVHAVPGAGAELPLPPGALDLAADRGTLYAAGELLGLAGRMVAMAVAYAKERRQFNRPIGSFQAIKHRLANAFAAVELARPTVYAAAWAVARRRPERRAAVSLAKLYANLAGDRAAREALQVHGGIGFAAEHDLHLWLKRAKALELGEGNSAFQREQLANHLDL